MLQILRLDSLDTFDICNEYDAQNSRLEAEN